MVNLMESIMVLALNREVAREQTPKLVMKLVVVRV